MEQRKVVHWKVKLLVGVIVVHTYNKNVLLFAGLATTGLSLQCTFAVLYLFFWNVSSHLKTLCYTHSVFQVINQVDPTAILGNSVSGAGSEPTITTPCCGR
jgi:hypothetical protein